jgi:predicted lysophospholipase L1 biosynthesis ABC-type transport system permease subunit
LTGGGLWALARLAWRDVARHRGRSLLVATVLALPTAMLASATVVFRTSDLAAGRSFGLSNLFMLVFVPIVAVAGLTAAAALGVGARRQLRELGLLAAAGGSDRHLRLLVLLQGFGLGLVGGLAGIPIGLAVTWAAFPWLRTLLTPVQDETGAPVVPRFSVVGRDMAWTVAFTVVLALLTALRPAVTASRVPVVAALAGRRPPRRLRPWLVAAGLVVALAGLVLQGVANQLDARGMILPVQLELLVLGTFGSIPSPLLITLAGIALCTPALVALAGRVVPARPAALRLAARDAARHPGRSAPAVTAVAAGLGVLVVLASLATIPGSGSSGWQTSEAGYVELQPATPAFPPALRVLLATFTVVAVAVVLAVNALGRAEARDDLAVLEALGASPRTRRALAAASAWLLTQLGALLGVAVGLSPLLVQRASRSLPTPYPMAMYPMAMPWPALALVVLVIPAVAAAAAALTTGGPTDPPTGRRPA